MSENIQNNCCLYSMLQHYKIVLDFIFVSFKFLYLFPPHSIGTVICKIFAKVLEKLDNIPLDLIFF